MSVLLIAEHNNKELKPFTLNAVTAASQIDPDLHVLVIGHNAGDVAKSASNIPLVNENSLPESLKKNPKMTCVVGLSTEPERLFDLRKNRMNSLKETENKNYTSIDNIKKEIEIAKKTFQKYKWPCIDVTRKSVEEAAASIIKIHEIYLNNVK